MDALIELAASLLSRAHFIFGPGVCPGDWVWATITAGAMLALLPVLGAFAVALMRKFTGSRYDSVTLSVIGVLGIGLALVLPWLLATGASEVYRGAFQGNSDIGLSPGELASLRTGSCWVGPQHEFLGGGPNVYEELFHPFRGTLMYLLYFGGLVVVPGVCAFFVMLQIRAALRRGPKWPGRLFWIPFVLFVVFSAPIESNTALYLWLGFLPISVLGLIPILVIGPPSWSTVERSHQRPDARPPGGDQQHQQHQQPYHQQSQPPRQNGGPPQPTRIAEPVPPPQQQYPPQQQQRRPPPQQQPMRPVMPPPLPPLREPEPDRQALAKLANDPGPLPFSTPDAPTVVRKPAPASRFRKIRALGHGGFGTVWLATDTQLDRTVALKMAHAPDDETEQRMLREARALAAVHHPNCVRVYDIVEDADGLGIVMEYIEGRPLADLVHDGEPLDDLAIARLWMTMAGGLNAAHAKGVLHRDVKPSNIIVDPRGSAHLIDFGIARTKGDSTLTATGMMVGTPDFLASEIAAGASATPSSDAWQLAATVSFAMTGHPPRGSRENAMAALMAAARNEPLTHLPNRSQHRRLLLASLDSNPARRPTLAVVEREMTRWLAHNGHDADGPVATTPVVRGVIDQADRTHRIN